MSRDRYIVSSAPHIRGRDSTQRIMWTAVLCLLPAGIAGAWIFGPYSAYVIAVSVISAVLTEAVLQKLTGRPVSAGDGSAVITGLLLAYNLPAGVPLWMPAAGAFFAVAVAKHAFGGLGKNIFNPALAGRAFLMTSWPGRMTSWVNPRLWPDAVSSATPLAKEVASLPPLGGHQLPVASFTYWDLFIGNRPGCIGEVCVLAILAGALVLLYRGHIRLHTPLSYIITVGLLTRLSGGDWLFAVLAGGLVLGAFFMATDMVTTPLTQKGQLVFGLGCGILTFAIRKWGGYPEGVSYSILMMNAATPIIDRFTRRK